MKQFRRSLAAILAIAMVLTTLGMTVVSAANTYSDVSGHWAQSYIQTWSNKSVINGYEDGTFRPDNNISRAEVAKVIVSAQGATALSSATFSDVAEGEWYTLYISRAVQAGYMTGDAEGTFRPNDPITREEAAAVMARAYNLNGSTDVTFSDRGAISDWALASVQALVAAGAINGYEDGTFQPQAYITRAELVKVLDGAYTAANTSSNGGSTIIGGGTTGGGNSGNGGTSSSTYYSVRFDANGGNIDGDSSYTVRVRRNSTLSSVAPVPERDGYEFEGWFRSQSAANSLNTNYEWNLSSDRVTAGVTLYAGWRASNELTVTFDYGNGTVNTEVVLNGETVAKPTEDAEREGFVFTDKWYTDPECTKAYNFSSRVTEDLVLYAGWELAEDTAEESVATITAEENANAEVSVYPQQVLAGETIKVRINADEDYQVATAVINYTDTTGAVRTIELEVNNDGEAEFTVPADADMTQEMTVVVTTEEAPEATATAAPTATSSTEPSEPTATATATTEPSEPTATATATTEPEPTATATTPGPTATANPDAQKVVYNFTDEDSDTVAEAYAKMARYTFRNTAPDGSDSSVLNNLAIATFDVEGEQATVLTMANKKDMNQDVDITYAVPDGITSFQYDMIAKAFNNKVVSNFSFYAVDESMNDIQQLDVARDGADPTGDAYVNWTYTGVNIPEGTKYISVRWQMADSGAGASQMAGIKEISYSVNEKWTVSDITVTNDADGVDVSWTAPETDYDYTTYITANNFVVGTVGKGTTSYTLTDLEDQNDYEIGVYAYANREEGDLGSNYVKAAPIKTGGSSIMLIDNFNVASVMYDDLANKEAVSSAGKFTAGRWGGTVADNATVDLIYYVPEGMTQVELEFYSTSYGDNNVKAGAIAVSETLDGTYETLTPEDITEGLTPNGFGATAHILRAAVDDTKYQYVKITLPSPARAWRLCVNEVRITRASEPVATATPAPTATATATATSAPTATAEPTTADVDNETDLLAALSNSNITTINLTGSFSVTQTVRIERGLTLNGGENTLTVPQAAKDGIVVSSGTDAVTISDLTVTFDGEAPTEWNSIYAIQAYNGTNLTLEDVTVSNANAGILVNGANVTLSGVVNVSNNTFGGIEVSKGQGVSNEPTLSGATENLSNMTEAADKPTIWTDGVEDTAVKIEGLFKAEITEKNQTYFFLNEANVPAQPTTEPTPTATATATAEPTATATTEPTPTATATVNPNTQKVIYNFTDEDSNTVDEAVAQMAKYSYQNNVGTPENTVKDNFAIATVDVGEGQATILTLADKKNMNQNVDITYAVPDGTTSAQFKMVSHAFNNKLVTMNFYALNQDMGDISQLDVVQDGANPTDSNYVYWTFNALNIPEGTKYISARFQMADSSQSAAQMVGFEEISFSVNDKYAVSGVAAENAGDGVKVSWTAPETDSDYTTYIAANGQVIGSVEKGTAEYTATELEDQSDYEFGVYVLVENESGDISSNYAKTTPIKSGGSENMLIDNFNVASVMYDDLANKDTVVSNGKFTWSKWGGSVADNATVDLIYHVPEGMTQVELEFYSTSYGDGNVKAGAIAVSETLEGDYTTLDVTDDASGVTPNGFGNTAHVLKATVNDTKYQYVKITLPSPARAWRLCVNEVRITKATGGSSEPSADPSGTTEYAKIDFTDATISEADSEQKKTVTVQNLISSGPAVTIETYGNYNSGKDTYNANRYSLETDTENGTYLSTTRKSQNSFLITLGSAVAEAGKKTVVEWDVKRVDASSDDPVGFALADSNNNQILSMEYKSNTAPSLSTGEAGTMEVNGDFMRMKAEIDFSTKTFKLSYSTDGGSSYTFFDGTENSYAFKNDAAENLMYIGNKDFGVSTKGALAIDNLYIYTM